MQTSHLGVAGVPGVKVTLVGSESPLSNMAFHADSDAFVFTEILEFALSLVPVTKGQDSFTGVPHMQAYRLIHASQLAEMGHIGLASRYCEAIGTTLRLGKPSPAYTQTFLEQLKEFSDRLSGTPTLDKSGSWIARKMTKPTFAGIGTWIESKATQFIAGEGEDATASSPGAESTKRQSKEIAAGPFAQFNVISSANTSPSASSANLAAPPPPPPAHAGLVPPPAQGLPRRSGSALAFRPYQNPSAPDRSASAMDIRPEPHSPYGVGPQIMSANAATTSFYQADHSYAALSDSAGGPLLSVTGSNDTEKPASNNWWDGGSSSNTDEGSKGTTPTFYSAEEPGSDNFVSPMDSMGPPPSKPSSFHSTPRSLSVAPVQEEDEEEDLGFGNASHKKKSKPEENGGHHVAEKKPAPTPPAKAATPAPAAAPAKTGRFIISYVTCMPAHDDHSR